MPLKKTRKSKPVTRRNPKKRIKKRSNLRAQFKQMKDMRRNNNLYHQYNALSPEQKCLYNLANGTMIINNRLTFEMYDKLLNDLKETNVTPQEALTPPDAPVPEAPSPPQGA